MSMRSAVTTGAVFAALAVAALAHGASSTGAGFSPHVTNPWFPLTPGTVYTYRGEKDGQPSLETLTVTHRTKTVAGTPCVVVHDLVWIKGHLVERTDDWYSQDAKGNVWYFGEDTVELDGTGHVTTHEGSWQTGQRNATAGILMPAHPRVGQAGLQEYDKGHAEDHFRVVSLHASVHVPYTWAKAALLTEEWSPLEAGVLDHKVYVRGIGTVLEQTVKGGNETNELVSVKR
jgi:hypothetical protein